MGMPLDRDLETGVQLGQREGGSVLEVSQRDQRDPDEKRVIALEFVAAASIFLIIALVLYMVFTYRPT